METDQDISPSDNIAAIKARIAKATQEAGRPAAAVGIVAVSKKHGIERIRPALVAGHRVFGENRVQEAQGKWPALKDEYPDVELHLIGPLQTNKTKEAIALFDVIQSLDREKLAKSLALEIEKQGRAPRLFVQVNTGEEPQKAGVSPHNADAFIKTCRQTYGLTIDGLMCIPTVGDEPALHFALLRKLAERNGLAGLSMGMSDDFETAAQLGATHVRIGSAIFGARPV
ncbi:MAG: YggS family pyridoxal phosphate-dependent enzyme [Pseudomonadota bacterium]